MKLQVLASGSAGNILVFQSRGGFCAAVDFGLSCRQACQRATACGLSLDDLSAIFFTHDHCDHIQGLATFAKRHPTISLYANEGTADAISRKTGVRDGWCVFDTAVTFEIGDIRVTPFSTSHDAADPVGYLFEEEGGATLFVGTDTGVVTTGLAGAYARATCAVLESNHDPQLLMKSDRPMELKQRIAGRSGHLANEDMADLVRGTAAPKLKFLLLAHLSEECNADHLARAAAREALNEAGRSDVTLDILRQAEPDEAREF